MKNRSPKLVEAFTYDDYIAMFDLDPTMLSRKIIEFPGCFSSFNATALQKNEHVTSLDPLYDLETPMLTNLIQQQAKLWETHVEMTTGNDDAHLIAKEKYNRFQEASSIFLNDYSLDSEHKRYVAWDTENKLPFNEHSFQLALCSHWLFKQKYSLQQVIDFIDGLCRVAGEVRIFPLLTEKFEAPDYLGHLLANFQTRGYQISCKAIDFDKHEEGSAMLCITSPVCRI